MSSNLVRTILALVVGAHGIGHVLFLLPLVGIADWGQSTRSWLLSGTGGNLVARMIGSIVWVAATLGFIVVAAGILGQLDWWRNLAIAFSAISILGLVLFWKNPASSSAFSALLFDVAVLVALLVFRWPSANLIGT